MIQQKKKFFYGNGIIKKNKINKNYTLNYYFLELVNVFLIIIMTLYFFTFKVLTVQLT